MRFQNSQNGIHNMTETVTFSTGAVRSSDRSKERYDLISPIGLRRLAQTCHEGAEKYSDYNWEKGMPISEMLNHGVAHIYAYLSGDRSEDHLAHAAWNMFGAMHSEEKWQHLNEGQLRGPNCTPPNVIPTGIVITSVSGNSKWGTDPIVSKSPDPSLRTESDR